MNIRLPSLRLQRDATFDRQQNCYYTFIYVRYRAGFSTTPDDTPYPAALLYFVVLHYSDRASRDAAISN